MPGVSPGDCVFSVSINDQLQAAASRVDVASQVGSLSLLTLQLPLPAGLPNNATRLSLRLQALPGSKFGPSLAGVELYGVMRKRAGVDAATCE